MAYSGLDGTQVRQSTIYSQQESFGFDAGRARPSITPGSNSRSVYNEVTPIPQHAQNPQVYDSFIGDAEQQPPRGGMRQRADTMGWENTTRNRQSIPSAAETSRPPRRSSATPSPGSTSPHRVSLADVPPAPTPRRNSVMLADVHQPQYEVPQVAPGEIYQTERVIVRDSLTREAAEDAIRRAGSRNGMYALRKSQSHPGCYVLCVCFDGVVLNYPIELCDIPYEGMFTLLCPPPGRKHRFLNLDEVVQHYTRSADGIAHKLTTRVI